MIQEIGSKTELETMAAKLETEVIQLTSDVSTLKSKFNNISNYDGINASGAANTLKSNLTNLASDLEAIATSIKLYSATLNNFDDIFELAFPLLRFYNPRCEELFEEICAEKSKKRVLGKHSLTSNCV